ncbi:hypothetical protein TSOC_001088 [Tetrabaena socialis]|uniref:Uncharacterized protein n=1 Tax=Tetrabaena socialis TaxID=47790 RepID=A0A2J8AHR1_9CHLO|nr:hypothetical protein TSOC_001088 [Tetrabaena socialis]|eukprot:PNH12052.1 hypothetical protein TSOC_001088 [Tetrabaena socialis]
MPQPRATSTARAGAVMVAASASASAVSSKPGAENPFDGSEDIPLLTTSGASVPAGEALQGRVVVGLLRHLG